MAKVWLDTNFLVYCIEKKISLSGLYEICPGKLEIIILSGVLYELSNLGGIFKKIAESLWRSDKTKNNTTLNQFLPFKYFIINNDCDVDLFIYKNVCDGDIVCTHDKELILMLKEKKVSIVNISNKRFVIL